MKKAGLPFLVLLISLATSISAETIPEIVAVKAAQKFFIQKTEQKWSATNNLVYGIYAQKNGNHILFYIVSFQTGGFVVVSADDRFYPVLAFSDEGCFDEKDMPEACKTWIKWYESQISEGLEKEKFFSDKNKVAWEKLLQMDFSKRSEKRLTGISPLLTCKWHQTGHFNQFCPNEPAGYNGHVPVGCVATAMSQVMYYFRFPQVGDGMVSYTPPYGNGKYGVQTADFGNSVYAWNEMNDLCTDPNPAIATLCYHAGVALHMDYTPTGSGADTEDVPFALSTYFNYSPAAEYHDRIDFGTYNEWKDMLVNSLDGKIPVIYRSTNGLSGHAYVCDGYQDSTHFHFNWGWGGNCDGYFFIDELIPGGINLSWAQGAVFNVFPDTTQFIYPEFCSEINTLTTSYGSFEDGSGPMDYLPNSSCRWLVQPSDPAITNMFAEFTRFKTENEADFLKIYDGNSENAPLIGIFSGTDIPQPVYSSGNALFLVFETGQSVENEGWHLNFTGYTLPFCDEIHQFTTASGTLEDGSRYLDYAPGTDCNWLIDPQIPADDSIRNFDIDFLMMKLAAGDTLRIFDGNSPESPLLGEFTGWEIPETISSASDQVYLNFVSDEAGQADGWLINLIPQSPVYCHDTIILCSENGIVTDGSGSKKYIENSDCCWLIKMHHPDSIHFNFNELDLELNYDYLKFTFMENGLKQTIKFTGNQVPAPFTLHADSVFVHFHSDYRDNLQGFGFQYTTASQDVFENSEDAVNIYPNPFSEMLKISLKNQQQANFRYEILNLKGQPELSGILSNPEEIIKTHHLSKGILMLKIYSAKAIFIRKMIKI